METSRPRLLAGPPVAAGHEPMAAHLARLGPLALRPDGIIDELRSAELSGRGGARFPAWRKWEAVRSRSSGRAVVVANGAEGEPATWKDEVLMRLRPHLVLDGALVAAAAVGARDVYVYCNRAFPAALDSLRRAVAERPERTLIRVVAAPDRYVAGEETAVVGFLGGAEARPAFTPPRPFERGVGGRPTLVQNVETFALTALIARFGAAWARGSGPGGGPLLLSIGGAVARPGVYEVDWGGPLAAIVAGAGGDVAGSPGILVGGYSGTWLTGREAGGLALEPGALSAAGVHLGTGAVHLLPTGACGVAAAAELMGFMAAESAGQCGPCVHGLASLAGMMARVAAGQGQAHDAAWLERWAGQLERGRGACAHPDGAVRMLRSALHAFAADFHHHVHLGWCGAGGAASGLPFRPASGGWR